MVHLLTLPFRLAFGLLFGILLLPFAILLLPFFLLRVAVKAMVGLVVLPFVLMAALIVTVVAMFVVAIAVMAPLIPFAIVALGIWAIVRMTSRPGLRPTV